jgi:adenylate cyclase
MNKRIIFALFGVIAAICTFLLYKQAHPSLQQLDFRMKDARFRIRGPVTPDKAVVVVAIDHKSIKEIGRWPWSREVTGRLVETLGTWYGTKVTALDIVFSEPQNAAADRALAGSIKKAGNVVLGYFFREEKNEPQVEAVAQLEGAKIKLIKVARYRNSPVLT